MLIGACSQLSGKTHQMEIDVSEKQITLWMEGALIQDVMPHLTPTEREFIKTGMSPMEQADIFPVLYDEGDF